jgi:D-glycero-D-manno-heptose 1,7-bisphosphate phosphatase
MNQHKAVFLDLQGTLGGEGLGDVRGFRFFPYAFDAVRRLNQARLPVLIVTSQSHIAKGYFSLADFDMRMQELNSQLMERGAKFDGVYCCPHGKEGNCSCRKPLPGLLLRAQRERGLELSRCYMVGDSGAWDMMLARAAGCRAVLVRTGLGESSLGEYRALWGDVEPDFIADTVLEAAEWIIHKETEIDRNPKTGIA